MPVTCTASSLMGLASCYRCQSTELVQAMRLRLLCAIANGDTTIGTTPSELAAASVCFLCLPKHTLDAIETYTLYAIANGATVTCEPAALAYASRCFLCLPWDVLDGMKTYLLCAAVNDAPVADSMAQIAVAAKCFSCLPIDIRAAIRVTLYCNLANGTTVECDPVTLAALSSGFLFQSLLDLGSMEVSAAAAAATGGGIPAPTEGLLYRLAAYWNLDEASGTRADSLGVSDLTDNNTVAQGGGIMGYSASFAEANSESLSCASNASLQVGGADFSVAFWANFSSGAADRIVLAGKGSTTNAGFFPPSTGIEWMFLYAQAAQDVMFYVTGSGMGVNLGGSFPSAWNFVYGEYEHAAGMIRMSVNGGPKTDGGFGLAVSTPNSDELCIGTEPTIHTNYWTGLVDEMGIWKRRLSDAEIDDLFSQGRAFTYPFTGGQVIDESGDLILDENGNIIFGQP